jgi:hypothetical protein
MEKTISLTVSEILSLKVALRLELEKIEGMAGWIYETQRADIQSVLEKLKK